MLGEGGAALADGSRDAASVFADFVSRAQADPRVLGIVLFGSRGFGAHVTDRSDFDLFVIGSEDVARWKTTRGSLVEVWPMTLDEFRDHGLSDPESAWIRPIYLGTQVVVDKLDGEIRRIVERKRVLDSAEAIQIVTVRLDDYINSLYRSLRNFEAGRVLEGRLDGLESVPPLLTAAFALERRVRPFNKWLRHELAVRPLAIGGLIELVEEIAEDPQPPAQRRAFRLVEKAAREAGYAAVVDGWEPDVDWLRDGRSGNPADQV